jgi:hypothetical protein
MLRPLGSLCTTVMWLFHHTGYDSFSLNYEKKITWHMNRRGYCILVNYVYMIYSHFFNMRQFFVNQLLFQAFISKIKTNFTNIFLFEKKL